MVKNYMKKPVVIRAIQYQGDLGWDVHEAFPSMKFWATTDKSENADPEWHTLIITTLEGHMQAAKGDYIIEGVKGEYYPCRQDIFEETYEEVQ